MKILNQDAEELLSVISVTENIQDAKVILDCYLRDLEPEEQEELLDVLETRDSRFNFWRSKYQFEYTSKNLTADSLFLSRKVANIIRSGEYKITVVLEEVL